ncbi:hypothetical protein OO010_02215 [Flavobacteriaceae bacterium KMM 6898]|nr:hypothetical protein [Flavobacteriaceae bacterium KMM 6898]
MKLRSLFFGAILFLGSCGPVVISSRPNYPPPPWFYPNRLEVVRYVYFPELTIYFDLTQHTYLYLNGGIWVRSAVLPPRYRNIDLRRSRYERVRNYRDDDIKRHYEQQRGGRSNIQRRSNNGN